jgi:hypothetical protein
VDSRIGGDPVTRPLTPYQRDRAKRMEYNTDVRAAEQAVIAAAILWSHGVSIAEADDLHSAVRRWEELKNASA